MQITTERLDDLVFLSTYIKQSGLVKQLDEHFPVHGHWQGPGFGQTLHGFLLYILSECRHSLYEVEHWASSRVQTLRWLLNCPDFEAKHLSDDRLGLLLERFGGSAYDSFQRSHNEGLIKVYSLENHKLARLDSVKVQSFSPANDLLGKGHKQVNKRSDLVSAKVMLVSLDPLALPISNLIVRGNRVDDRLYIPAIQKAWQEGLAQRDMLFVGDTKLGNQNNWSFIAESENYYLSPLSLNQFSRKDLAEALQWIENSGIEPIPFYGHQFDEQDKVNDLEPRAHFLELPTQIKSNSEAGLEWSHRLLAVCNVEMRKKQLLNLEQRCEQAIIQLQQRFTPKQGKRHIRTQEEAQDIVNQFIKKFKVDSLIEVTIKAPEVPKGHFQISCALNSEAYQQFQKLAGWSVFASNAPQDSFSAYDLLRIYRQQYRIEQQFHKLLNKCTALEPIFLQKPNRIKALIRILILALQFVSLIQHQIRTGLSKQELKFLKNLIPGNPGRKVFQPTTSLILKAFNNIDLIIMQPSEKEKFYQVTQLSEIQKQILTLVNIPLNVYSYPTPGTNKILTEI